MHSGIASVSQGEPRGGCLHCGVTRELARGGAGPSPPRTVPNPPTLSTAVAGHKGSFLVFRSVLEFCKYERPFMQIIGGPHKLCSSNARIYLQFMLYGSLHFHHSVALGNVQNLQRAISNPDRVGEVAPTRWGGRVATLSVPLGRWLPLRSI